MLQAAGPSNPTSIEANRRPGVPVLELQQASVLFKTIERSVSPRQGCRKRNQEISKGERGIHGILEQVKERGGNGE